MNGKPLDMNRNRGRSIIRNIPVVKITEKLRQPACWELRMDKKELVALTDIFEDLFELSFGEAVEVGRLLQHGEETAARTELHHDDFVLASQLQRRSRTSCVMIIGLELSIFYPASRVSSLLAG